MNRSGLKLQIFLARHSWMLSSSMLFALGMKVQQLAAGPMSMKLETGVSQGNDRFFWNSVCRKEIDGYMCVWASQVLCDSSLFLKLHGKHPPKHF